MKLDGHAKLTNRSIELFRSRCAQATDIFIRATVCQLPQLHTFDLEWTNAEESNEADNSMIFRYIAIQELTVFGESFHRLHDGYLTREVVAVDIEPFKLPLHVLESGQRYHFMRRNASASVRTAHRQAVDFLHEQTSHWLRLMTRVLHTSRSGRHPRAAARNPQNWQRREAVSHLALALHALQDSFSPAHTRRTRYSTANHPGAIEDIHVYADQDSAAHGTHDFEAGSLNSLDAQAAVNASADLLDLCARSVAVKSTAPIGWREFEERWVRLSPLAR